MAKRINQGVLTRKLKGEPGPIEETGDRSTYRFRLADALNFYTTQIQDPEYAREFLIRYAEKEGTKDQVQAIADTAATKLIPTYGWLARLAALDSALWPEDKKRLENYVASFETEKKAAAKVAEQKEEPKVQKEDLPIEDQMPNAVAALDKVDREIDRYMSAGKGQLNDKILQGVRFSSKKELTWFKDELAKVYNQVFEGVEDEQGDIDRDSFNVKPTNVRKVREFIEALQAKFAAPAKAERKSKAKKPKDPTKAVKDLKYRKETDALKSESPRKLVGAKVAVIYDVDRHDLVVLEAAEGGLDVTGSTIKNVGKVRKKKVRDKYLDRVPAETSTCKKAEDFLKNLPGKESERYTTRMNENRMILGVR